MRYEKGTALKGKNLLPLGANSFLLEQTLFQKGIDVKVNQTESHKSCLSQCKNGESKKKTRGPRATIRSPE